MITDITLYHTPIPGDVYPCLMRYKRPDVGWDEIYVDDLPIIIVFAKRACSNGMALVGVVVKTHPKFHHSVGYCSDGWDASSFEPITGVNWSVKLEGTTM